MTNDETRAALARRIPCEDDCRGYVLVLGDTRGVRVCTECRNLTVTDPDVAVLPEAQAWLQTIIDAKEIEGE